MQIWSAEIKELEKFYDSFKGHLPDLEREVEQMMPMLYCYIQEDVLRL